MGFTVSRPPTLTAWFDMPNQPKTPARSVRVPDDLWRAAQAKAEERGETVTDAILRALSRYVASQDR